ncbi:hypothetical protein [Spirosoma spitsbergense]|uniref:hypothetical protein n=1 Tax=Spirosoma spitsbergense TaxID=431554 RepID=UPI00035F3763|nr:hypothetical protein [Spirosoma spitsbergense]
MIKRKLCFLYLGIWLPYLAGSVVCAQNNTLKQCSTEQVKAMQEVTKNRSTAKNPLLLFDSTQQKYQQIHQNWAECVKGHHISLSSFKTLDGESYDSSALVGKVLVFISGS